MGPTRFEDEMRRCVGVHATNQAHGLPGSGRINHERIVADMEGRRLGGCVVCARNSFVGILYRFDLPTPLADEVGLGEEDTQSLQARDNNVCDDSASVSLGGSTSKRLAPVRSTVFCLYST